MWRLRYPGQSRIRRFAASSRLISSQVRAGDVLGVTQGTRTRMLTSSRRKTTSGKPAVPAAPAAPVEPPLSSSKRTVAAVAGGVLAFWAMDEGAKVALSVGQISFPSSIAALLGLGCACFIAPSTIGTRAQMVLGPAAATFRAVLPLLLIPPFLMPVTAHAGQEENLGSLATLCVASLLGTFGVTATIATLFAVKAKGTESIPVCRISAATGRILASGRTAFAALSVGVILSATVKFFFVKKGLSSAQVFTPAYLGLTVAAYSCVTGFFPKNIRKYIPPNVGAAFILLPLLLVLGGKSQVEEYLEGAGAMLMAAVHPAMVTLGLYAFTHRELLLGQKWLILALAISAPALSLLTAYIGSQSFDLAPSSVAAALTAHTTTGLALTMNSGLPLIPIELVAILTAFASGLGQLFLPILLRGGAVTRIAVHPVAQGTGIGCASHVGGMAALSSSGNVAAADMAAIALVVFGVARAICMQFKPFSDLLFVACGGGKHGDHSQSRNNVK